MTAPSRSTRATSGATSAPANGPNTSQRQGMTFPLTGSSGAEWLGRRISGDTPRACHRRTALGRNTAVTEAADIGGPAYPPPDLLRVGGRLG